MKITKRQLKRIIKEERARLLRENVADRLESAVIATLEDTLDLPGMNLDPEQAAQIVRNSVNHILDQAVEGLNQTMDDDFDPDRPAYRR